MGLQRGGEVLRDAVTEAKDRNIETSLAVFKPTKVVDFIWESVDREWSEKKLAALMQYNLFETTRENKLEVEKKLPFKFSYIFEDNQGKEFVKSVI